MNIFLLTFSPLIASAITQIAKKFNVNPHIVLGVISLLFGIGYAIIMQFPENWLIWIGGFASYTQVGATGLYKNFSNLFANDG